MLDLNSILMAFFFHKNRNILKFFITRGTYRSIYEKGMNRMRMKETVPVAG